MIQRRKKFEMNSPVKPVSKKISLKRNQTEQQDFENEIEEKPMNKRQKGKFLVFFCN